MSNLGPAGARTGRPPMLPTPPTGTTIARYATYAEAQKAVDFLSDNTFPVQHVTIVGTDLRMVERVTGRLTYGRVALGGAASGAYFGLFVGLLLTIFASGQSFGLLFAVLIGAGFGMLFGVLSYSFTGGRRDFTSMSQIVASEYQVLCAEDHARAAMEVLGRLAAAGGPRGLGQPAQPQNPYTAPQAGQQVDPYGPPPGSAPTPPQPTTAPPTAAFPQPAPTSAQPAPQDAAPAAPTPDAPVEGLTYGEVMEARRRERVERELEEARKAREEG